MESKDAANPAVPRSWGYVATIAWVILAAVLAVALSTAWFALVSGGRIEDSPDLLTNGPLLAELTFVSTVVEIGVVALAARLARWSVADYLALAIPDTRAALVPLVAMAGFVVGYDLLTSALNHDIVTPFQLDTYRTARAAGQLPMLWIAFVVAAPMGEEIVFRGFLYRGWARSPGAVVPAITAISALWAIIHVQYDWFGIVQIFFIGLLLGWARWRSGSTLLTVALHGLANAWAMIETIVKIESMA